MIELLVVIVIVGILAGFALTSYTESRKYAAVDQAKKLVDFLDEARQKALNQRSTFRVEINRTKNRLRLIDENAPETADDDVEVKSERLSSLVTIGPKPSNTTGAPTATSPIPTAAYASNSYPLSSGDQKITLRFRRNGQVVDTGTDNIGTGSMVNGMTIYVYSTSGTKGDVIRAVTVLGTSGDTSFYTCKFDSAGNCGAWSR